MQPTPAWKWASLARPPSILGAPGMASASGRGQGLRDRPGLEARIHSCELGNCSASLSLTFPPHKMGIIKRPTSTVGGKTVRRKGYGAPASKEEATGHSHHVPSRAHPFNSTPMASNPRAAPWSGSNTDAPFGGCVQGRTGSPLNHSQGSLPPGVTHCPLGLASQAGLPSSASSRLTSHPRPGQATENPSFLSLSA